MPLLKNGQLTSDPWTFVADDAPLAGTAMEVISLTRWQAERATLLERSAPLGLLLQPGEVPHDIADDLGRFDLIALAFPAFKDGRAYSYARLIRERFGFTGELRAVGQVLRDQVLFMYRCGFDAFEVDDRVTPDVFAAEIEKFSVRYQPANDTAPTALSLRERRLAAQAAE